MPFQRPLLATLTLAAATMMSAAHAAPTVYFGEDQGAGSIANMPSSFAARDQFVAQLAGVGVEDVEGFAAGTDFFNNPGVQLDFTGSGVTASISGGFVRDVPYNARFAVSGSKYIDSSFNRRITFSTPVGAFGLFVIDAFENNNNPATVTVNGQPLTQEQIAARPFDSIDGVFRIVTERSPGNFEVLFDGGTFPSRDSSALFIGLIDDANPYSNILLINGTSGLDLDFQDGFGYDDLMVARPVPEPSTWLLMALGLVGATAWAQRRNAA
jgi:hypothetical protein